MYTGGAIPCSIARWVDLWRAPVLREDSFMVLLMDEAAVQRSSLGDQLNLDLVLSWRQGTDWTPACRGASLPANLRSP